MILAKNAKFGIPKIRMQIYRTRVTAGNPDGPLPLRIRRMSSPQENRSIKRKGRYKIRHAKIGFFIGVVVITESFLIYLVRRTKSTNVIKRKQGQSRLRRTQPT